MLTTKQPKGFRAPHVKTLKALALPKIKCPIVLNPKQKRPGITEEIIKVFAGAKEQKDAFSIKWLGRV